VNRFPVRNPQHELDGPTIGDLIMWQIAGMGVVSPVTFALLTIAAGPSLTLTASGEAWDPDAGSIPTIAYVGVGTYTVQYATTYPDKDAITQTTNLLFATALLQTLSDFRATAKVQADKRTIDVRVRNAAGALADMAIGDAIAVMAW
jgi:hypothetical protein